MRISADVAADLRNTLKKAEIYTDCLCNGYQAIILHQNSTAEERTAAENDSATAVEAFRAVQLRVYRAINGVVAQVNPAAHGAPAVEAPNFRPVRDMKPPHNLTADTTPAEFNDWLSMYRTYHTVSGFQRHTPHDQQNFMKMSLDKTLRERLSQLAHDGTPIFDPPPPPDGGELDPHASCARILEDFFKERCPIGTRRHRIFSRRQKPGEVQADVNTEIRRQAAQADLSNITFDKLLAQLFILSCTDEKLKRKLLALKDPSANEVDMLCQSYAQVSAELETTRDAASAPAVAAFTKSQPTKNKGKGKSKGKGGANSSQEGSSKRPNPLADLTAKGICYVCGGRHDVQRCTARQTAKCTHCGRQGHLARICLSAAAARLVSDEEPPTYADAADEQEGHAYMARGGNQPTPPVML